MATQSNVVRAVQPDSASLSDLAARLSGGAKSLDLRQRLSRIRDAIPGRIVLTTSFGLEAQAITHAISEDDLDIEIVTIDTGRLFPETHAVWAETEARYGRRIRSISPNHERIETFVAREGIDGFRASIEARRACCHIRKVEPLARALAGASAWVTGIRREQSRIRTAMPYAAFDAAHGVIKVNPLLDWTRARVVEYIAINRVPYNALHDRGFLSIGCAPCTRPVALGEPERAGRWWWEQEDKKECGLHVDTAPEFAEQDA
jgi:phosphoadenosine phosphosulfate reductase